MGKKEFANQQPTQNLIGRGKRGIYNTVHTKGKSSPQPVSVPLSSKAASGGVWDLNLGVFSPPSSPFFI